jgi:hypothetical protein
LQTFSETKGHVEGVSVSSSPRVGVSIGPWETIGSIKFFVFPENILRKFSMFSFKSQKVKYFSTLDEKN